ncbi:MAG: hypothetical protein J4F42_22090 [Desulfurellaceae bacterium]|nr:hypothetical protein [Desulfurellaceae bacterium]
MTEYETAALAVRQAALAVRQAALAVQHDTLSLGYWQVAVAFLVGMAQCALIAWGVAVMKGNTKSRDASLEALADIGAGIRELLRERSTNRPAD